MMASYLTGSLSDNRLNQSHSFFSVIDPAAELSGAARKNGRFTQQMDNIPIPT